MSSYTTLWARSATLASIRSHCARQSFLTVSAAAILQGVGLLLPGFGPNRLGGIWENVLRAVPKKKTTHSKTRMRSATKGLKDRTGINNCSACGKPKLAHTICLDCFTNIRRRWNGKGEVEV